MSNNYYRNFIDSSFDWEYWIGADGDLLEMNARAEELSGFAVEVFKKDPGLLSTIFHPNDREAYDQHVARMNLHEEDSLMLSFRIISKSGAVCFIEQGCRAVYESNTFLGYRVSNRDITDRKSIQAELQKERKRLAGILRGTNSGTWEWNVQTGETVFNERWAEIVGYKLEELAPISIATWQALAHPGDLADSAKKLEQHFSGELDYYEHEARMRHREGHWVWVLDRGCIVEWTEEGKPLMMMGTHQDITQRKKGEEQLRNQEERFRKLFEFAPIGMAINEMETGQFVEINDALLAPTGYTKEEFLALSYWQITPEKYQAAEAEMLISLNQHGRYGPFQKEYIRKDGTRYEICLNGFLITDLKGRKWIYSIIEDISARKQIERSMLQLARAVEQSPSMVLITDLEGRITYANQQFSKVTGYSIEELIGQKPSLLKADENNPQQFKDLWKKISCGEEWRGELLNKRKDGSIYWASSAINSIQDEKGYTSHYLAMSEDITEKKTAQKQLETLNNELSKTIIKVQEFAEKAEAANKSKGEFLANMSHEIRTPMNGVIGMIGLLLDTELTSSQRHQAEIVRSSAESLLDLINDILDFSKIEAGHLDLEILPFDLIAMTRDFTDMMAIRAMEKSLTFKCIVDPNTPKVIAGDQGRLRQILTNLATNALKFTQQGEVILRVQAHPRHNADDKVLLEFAVSDTGIGIPKDKQALLFSRFEQLDSSTTRKYGGTGLGLAISKQLSEMMGGRISVESQLGVGSTFRVQIPVAIAHESAHREAATPQTDSQHLKGRILLAEDNSVNQMVACSLLQKLGLEVEVVETGIEAVLAVQSKSYDLILMDVQMPEMDGLQSTLKIREVEIQQMTEPIPIIAMTAHAMEKDRDRCIQSGMNDYLSKPIAKTRLQEVLRRWLPDSTIAKTQR